MTRALPLLLIACAATDDPADGDDTDVAVFDGLKLAALSDGDCPGLNNSGTKTFSSSGNQRDVVIHLPDVVEPGLPVIFVWHGLGDSAESMSAWMGLSRLAERTGAVIVVPDSQDRNGNTWAIAADGGDDLVLFDDLRTCLSERLDIDLARVTTTGFSFGGLWTTWLTMRRSKAFATAMPMSGGTDPFFVRYDTPKHTLPVLVMWGGDVDTYGSGVGTVYFEDSSLDFVDNLRRDGHFVVTCDHGLGHNVPPDIGDVSADWLLAHTYGAPSPFQDGVDSLPGYCSAP